MLYSSKQFKEQNAHMLSGSKRNLWLFRTNIMVLLYDGSKFATNGKRHNEAKCCGENDVIT